MISIRLTAATAMLALLPGCGGMLRSDAPADQIYVIRPAAAATQATPLPAMIAVARPLVQPGLATTGIALTRPGNRLDY